MKISFCSLGAKTEPLWDVLDKVAAAGYDGIEIAELHLQPFLENPAEFQKLKTWLADHKMAVPVISSGFAFVEPEAFTKSLEKFRKLGQAAVDLGKAQIRVFMDWITDEDNDRELKTPAIIRGLQALDQIAAELGINLVLETHQQQLMDSLANTQKLLQAAGVTPQSHIKINLDIHNLFFVGDDPVDCLLKLQPYVTHVHLKNGVRVEGDNLYGKYGYYLDAGEMDYAPFLRKIQEIGYTGFMSIEWFGDDVWGAAKHEIDYLRQFYG